MDILFNVVTTIFWGMVMFSLIVLVHEAGHYTAARLCGMRVREFMLGLPGPNIGLHIGETRFGITPILLGGYALIAGMMYETESPTLAITMQHLALVGSISAVQAADLSDRLGYDFETDLEQLVDWGVVHRKKTPPSNPLFELAATKTSSQGQPREIGDAQAYLAEQRRRTYLGSPYPARVFMLVSGAVFNLVFAIIIFVTAIMISGEQRATTTVSQVAVDSPAQAVGVQAGDRLVELDGQTIDSWDRFREIVSAHQVGDEVSLVVERDGQLLEYRIVLAETDGHAFVGVVAGIETVPVGFLDALRIAFLFIGMVAVSIIGLLNPTSFPEVISQSSSVIGISVEASNAAEAGLIPFLLLAAVLSVSIGLMNLLPIPPLDGGKIVLETVQRIIRRPIPIRLINSISLLALVFLGLMFVFVTWQDIQRYILPGL